MIDALVRLCSGISSDFEMPDLPVWVLANRVQNVVENGECTELESQAREVVVGLHALESQLYAKLHPGEAGTSCGAGPSNGKSVSPVMLARLLLGSCCEMYASIACSLVCPLGERPSRKRNEAEAIRLYKDSFLAAVWTSAHAQCISDCISMNSKACDPNIHMVPSELSELDLSDLYARRTCPRAVHSKDALHLLALMTRCTNPGARG